MSRQDPSFVLYLGNLRRDCKKGELKQNIIALHRQLRIEIGKKYVSIVQTSDTMYALVYFKTAELLRRSLNITQYDVTSIVVPGQQLIVERAKAQTNKTSVHTNSDSSDDEYSHRTVAVSKRSGTTNPTNGTGAAPKSYGASKKRQPVYIKGQNLGNETRNVEFKLGQGEYIKKQLIHDVSKYMCAFLNSDGGTLFIGVSDDGTVNGISGIDRGTEDKLRCQIDAAIQSMKVFTSMYEIRFIDVLNSNGSAVDSLKMIEKEVKKGTAERLYETGRGEVYVRRDGSVQGPLKASDIQEWYRIKTTKELENATKHVDDLRQIQSLQTVKQEKEMEEEKQSKERLRRDMERLELEKAEVESRSRLLKYDLKVIAVEVEKGTQKLYETNHGEVFMRRDGSVQGPLKTSQIQEWHRSNKMEELDKVDKTSVHTNNDSSDDEDSHRTVAMPKRSGVSKKRQPMSDTDLVQHGANTHGHVEPSSVSTFKFIKGRKLGNETRKIEFKPGGYVLQNLNAQVSKYMCAFLNSEGGTLLLGVSDDERENCTEISHGDC